jgi:hypothetical protein
MLVQILTVTFLVATNVAIHGALTTFSIWKLRRTEGATHSFGRIILILTRLAVWCVLAHVVEIMIWALFYVGAGVMPDLETASYFSAVTYATIGYGDITPPEDWRLLASIEGLTGILMCAWSGGFIFAIVSRLLVAGQEPQA